VPDDCGLDEEPLQVGNIPIELIADTQQEDNITMVRMEEEEVEVEVEVEVEGGDGDSDAGLVLLAKVVDGEEEVSWSVAIS